MRNIAKQRFERVPLTSADGDERALQSPPSLNQRLPLSAVSNLLRTNLSLVDLPDLSVLAGNPTPKTTQTARGSRGALSIFGDAARLLGIFHLRAPFDVARQSVLAETEG